MKSGNKPLLFCWALFILLVTQHGNLPATESERGVPVELQEMVILEQGRIKPLDTFAGNVLKQISGRSEFEKQPAITWLERVLLSPFSAEEDKVFLINNPEVLNALGLQADGRDRDRYSYTILKDRMVALRQLAVAANNIDEASRSFVESEFIMLFNKLSLYQQLTATFQFALPHADFSLNDNETAAALGLPDSRRQYSMLDFVVRSGILLKQTAAIDAKKPGERSAGETRLLEINQSIKQWLSFYRQHPVTIIPPINPDARDWLSTWDMLNLFWQASHDFSSELVLIGSAVRARQAGNWDDYSDSLAKFNQTVRTRAESVEAKKLSLEVSYNKLDPFYKAEFFYGFSILLLLLSSIVLKKWLYRSSLLLMIAGFILHSIGLTMRVIIRGRPPVTNLYETFVFAAWMTVLLGIILELAKKRNIGILTSAISGLILLLIAGKYAMEGDTMGMLMAVLDSNFWLATHVITITVGYAGIVISGALGHLYLFQEIFLPKGRELVKDTFQSIYATQAFGLIFTFIGTVLGGIWADQSWGRFWGWDPKENGALLIVLWSAILLHAKLSKIVGKLGFALGSIVGIITVVLAWFGVNLLGVGLHSYGFTGGVAKTLFIFILFEVFLMAICGTVLKLKTSK